MTSKCGKNKEVAHEAIAEWVTNAEQAQRKHGIYLFYIIKKQIIKAFFNFKISLFTRKSAFVHFGQDEKSHLT